MDRKIFLGVVHLAPLPSASGYAGSFDSVLARALEDATGLRDGGVDGVMVENFGDAPFRKGTQSDRVAPDVPAALAVIAREIRNQCGVEVGVNCLRNDVRGAIGAGVCAGARWIRANVLSGSFVTDQGTIEGEAADVAAYRRQTRADVTLLADLMVKHAAPLAPMDSVTVAKDLVARSGADGIIVTGARTGEAVDVAFLDSVRVALLQTSTPIWIGSGLNEANARDLWPRCDGAIVATSIQTAGRIDERRVASLRSVLDASH